MAVIFLYVILAIILPVACVIGGLVSIVVNRYPDMTYNERLGVAMVLGIPLAFCACVLVLALVSISPTTLLTPLTAPFVLITVILLNLRLIRKNQ
ncbi:MAG: hypothetical protein ACFFDR_10685 [Candidatus Thorarchaeota archaeon]